MPGLLLASVIGLCDKILADVKATGELQQTFANPGGPAGTFSRFSAAEWDERRTAYRDPADGRKEAAE
jgi:hypothetical protein